MSDTTAMSAVQANQYDLLLESINQSLLHGREQIASAVSQTILRTYWEIGRNIVEFEQQGQAKADYGSELLALSKIPDAVWNFDLEPLCGIAKTGRSAGAFLL